METFLLDTRSSNLNQMLGAIVFTDCLYSLNDLNILKLWQSIINSISGVTFLSFFLSEMEQMICRSSHTSSLQQKRTALQQERQSLANMLEGEFKSFISWEINGGTLSLFFSHHQEAKHTSVVSRNSPALILLSSMWKKTEPEAAQCKHRLRLVEIKHFTAVNAHGRHCWWCVATGVD